MGTGAEISSERMTRTSWINTVGMENSLALQRWWEGWWDLKSVVSRSVPCLQATRKAPELPALTSGSREGCFSDHCRRNEHISIYRINIKLSGTFSSSTVKHFPTCLLLHVAMVNTPGAYRRLFLLCKTLGVLVLEAAVLPAEPQHCPPQTRALFTHSCLSSAWLQNTTASPLLFQLITARITEWNLRGTHNES